ncbi:MAG TPA: OmpA family protein [Bryobacteraceae bacterium]|nr:OmpA family protein [Bryobacteraceae bacterium]
MKTSVFVGLLSVLSLAGCATKKHVREAIAPVQNQINQTQGQVNALQKQSDEAKQQIGDLDRQVAAAEEKATDSGRKAADAADAAMKANAAATEAGQRAEAANSAAQQAQQAAAHVGQEFNNLDNYQLSATEQVYFGLGRSTLTKEDQAKLDDAISKIHGMQNYIMEVEGFADRTGDRAYNRELSRRRADAVVHYLAVEHDVPLRVIREVGAGADFPDADNQTREARKQNRRVDVRIYALDLNGQVASASTRPATQQ